MSKASAARRIAVAAAYGGGGISVLGATTFGLLATEARLARRAIPAATAEPPVGDGLYGDPGAERSAEAPVSFVVLGDSSAAGFGVHKPHETPGALLASGLAEASGRLVRLTVVAKVGAQTSDLDRQVTLALTQHPDVALIMIGANDVTHRVRPGTSVRLLDGAVRRLRAAGCEAVVGTCPDLGTIEPVAQPLRTIARQWSRQLAAAQTIVVVEAGGRSVSLGDILGPEFAARPKEMFAADRFHPSAAGYRAAAMVLLPSVCAAMGAWPEGEEEAPDVRRGEGLRSVADAAVEAARTAGTEVSGAELAGRERGPRGRWTLLRRRRRRQIPEPSEVDEQELPTPSDGEAEASARGGAPDTETTSSA
ncbi:MAG: SGNH/GDSL hydrolase family protein [Motilibacteraceae bacterium]